MRILVAAIVLATGVLVGGAGPAQAASRSDIVATARAEIGSSEANGGCAKYGPCQTYDWCAMFTNWVWRQAGVSAYPETWVARAVGTWGVERGLFKARPSSEVGSPAPGDIVVYGTPAQAQGGHVSIVAAVHGDGTISTVDGNVSDRVLERRINPLTARAGGDNLLISGYVSPPGITEQNIADRDVSGDGAADLLTVHTDGKLYYYPNNIKTSNGVPFGGASWVSLTTAWGGVKQLSAGDISGDKHSDLMVVDADNKLYYYPNNIGSSNGVPFGNAAWASQGATWGGVKHVSAGDISGDGFADLMVVDADGKLYYYPNNIRSSNGVPFGGASWASQGATWGGVKRMSVADVSGDGYADLLVVDADNKLYYYPNNINANDGVPFGAAAWVSQGATWGGVSSISAGDISGDGFADLMVIDADGKLYYYPNNMNANNGAPFTTAVWASTSTAWAGNRLAG
jgi:hypothetical protein